MPPLAVSTTPAVTARVEVLKRPKFILGEPLSFSPPTPKTKLLPLMVPAVKALVVARLQLAVLCWPEADEPTSSISTIRNCCAGVVASVSEIAQFFVPEPVPPEVRVQEVEDKPLSSAPMLYVPVLVPDVADELRRLF